MAKSQTVLGIVFMIMGVILAIIGLIFFPIGMAALIWGIILFLIGIFLIIFRDTEDEIEQIQETKKQGGKKQK